jgi:uncharacterized protein
MPIFSALLIGLLFGVGILLSGMGNPAKVLNFFDVAGSWDPSLAFVMGGALLVNVVGTRLALGRGKPLLDSSFHLPKLTRIDATLLGGAAVFGIGWGLSGFCPGGLLPVLGLGRVEPLLFFAGLVAGMLAARFAQARSVAPAAQR